MSQTAGQLWAKGATAEQLELLEQFDDVRGRIDFNGNPYTLAELTAFAIAGLDPEDYDRDIATTFWWDSEVDDDFVNAFIDGALSYQVS